MEYTETIQAIENKRVPLLQRLKMIMASYPASLGDHCQDIGVHRNTFKAFINGKAISLRTFKKIEKYVKGKE